MGHGILWVLSQVVRSFLSNEFPSAWEGFPWPGRVSLGLGPLSVALWAGPAGRCGVGGFGRVVVAAAVGGGRGLVAVGLGGVVGVFW